MFKRKSKELVKVKKVNKMLNEILKSDQVMTRSGGGFTWCGSAIPTTCVENIARKYGFLKEKK